MPEIDATSPAEPDVAPEPIEAQEATETPEPQLDENGEPIEPPKPKRAIKFIDHDIELPDEVDDSIAERLTQIGKELEAGATRKFQSVAEERRAVEAERARVQAEAQAMQQNFGEIAELKYIDKQLETYKDWTPAHWQQFAASDPTAAQQHFMQYTTLQNQRSQLAGSLQAKQQEFTQRQTVEQERLISEGQRALAEKIPEWGAAKQQSLAKHAQEAYGFKPDELSHVMDPRVVLMMHDAYLYRQQLAKAKAKPEAPTPQPVQKVGAAAPVGKAPERMSMDEWLEWRTKQLRRKK